MRWYERKTVPPAPAPVPIQSRLSLLETIMRLDSPYVVHLSPDDMHKLRCEYERNFATDFMLSSSVWSRRDGSIQFAVNHPSFSEAEVDGALAVLG